MIIAVGIALAALTFPWGDFGAAVQKPSPASLLQVAADVAASAIPFNPQARVAAVALNVAVIMARHPAQLPMREAQTAMGRGGRRG